MHVTVTATQLLIGGGIASTAGLASLIYWVIWPKIRRRNSRITEEINTELPQLAVVPFEARSRDHVRGAICPKCGIFTSSFRKAPQFRKVCLCKNRLCGYKWVMAAKDENEKSLNPTIPNYVGLWVLLVNPRITYPSFEGWHFIVYQEGNKIYGFREQNNSPTANQFVLKSGEGYKVIDTAADCPARSVAALIQGLRDLHIQIANRNADKLEKFIETGKMDFCE